MKRTFGKMWICSIVVVLAFCCVACAKSVESDSSAEPTEDVVVPEYTEYEKKVIDAYCYASSMADWFRTGTVDCDMMTVVEFHDTFYYKVKDYETLEALHYKLNEAFSTEYAGKLI